MEWKKFWRMTMGGVFGLGVILFAAVVIVDPYDSLIISPPLARVPITQNHRFSYPALARNSRFDSAVIGTSTSRLLRPDKLQESLGGAFVNLSMNSATAYEQSRIFALFARHHHFRQPAPGSRDAAIWQECKRRLTDMAGAFTNSHVLDFMIPSEITLADENYWDVLHFNRATADRIAELIAQGVRQGRGAPGYFEYLGP